MYVTSIGNRSTTSGTLSPMPHPSRRSEARSGEGRDVASHLPVSGDGSRGRRRRRTRFASLAMIFGAFVVAVAPAAPASAATGDGHQNGYCDIDELCLFYHSSAYNYGSVSDFYYEDGNLHTNRFISPHAGQGQVVANNAAAFRNNDDVLTAHVWTGKGWTGRHGYIPPNRVGNFTANYKNNVESITWG